MIQPTRQQRRAAERRAKKRPAVKTLPVPYFHKIQSKLPRLTLQQLKSFLKRFTKVRDQLGFAFKRWKRETQGRLSDDQWPDKKALIEIALCHTAVCETLARRTAKIEPPVPAKV